VSAFVVGEKAGNVRSSTRYCIAPDDHEYRLGSENFTDVNDIEVTNVSSWDPRLDGTQFTQLRTSVDMVTGAGPLEGSLKIVTDLPRATQLSLKGTAETLFSPNLIDSFGLGEGDSEFPMFIEGLASGKVDAVGSQVGGEQLQEGELLAGQLTANFWGIYLPGIGQGDSEFMMFLGPIGGALNNIGSTDVGSFSTDQIPALEEFLSKYAPQYSSSDVQAASEDVGDFLNGAVIKPAGFYRNCSANPIEQP
jgi:hypothetical protein